jgi:hypothetical protein
LSQDDYKPDVGDLIAYYGVDEINRCKAVFGTHGSPDAKPITHNILKMEAGKVPPDKRNKGGIVKSLDDYARVIRIRLEFLRLTIDQDQPQHVARAKLAQMFELSKKRISNLTTVRKSPSLKK